MKPSNHDDLCWQPIESAPEDEHILIATKGEWVGEASYIYDEDEEQRIWSWSARDRIHPNHEPLAWMPLPTHPEE